MLVPKSLFMWRSVVVSAGRRHLHYPAGGAAKNVRLSWSKEIMNKVVPFTGELIGTNQISFEGAAVRYHSESLEAESAGAAAARTPEHSWVEIILPFSDHIKLRKDMMLSNRTDIRYGKLFEILDSLAADVAMRHAGGRDPTTGQYSMTIVTAAIDKMHIYRDINVTSDIILRGYVGHVGVSSMEICIDILDTADEVLGETMFIMVARDPVTEGAVRVPQLSMETAESKQKYLQGELRSKARKNKRSSSLSKSAPKSSEIELIHSLYLQSVALKQQKDRIVKTALTDSDGPSGSHDSSLLLSSKVKWMKDTVFKNVYLMYPQDRNLHGNIFGGHILRRAFEAARVSASFFFGTEDKIRFRAVDDIHFVKPVPVGCVVEFTSTVTYSERNVCVVNVRAATVDVASGVKDMTNSFNYLFSVPMKYVDIEHMTANSSIHVDGVDLGQTPFTCAVMDLSEEVVPSDQANSMSVRDSSVQMKLPKVVPREYFEIVHYLEGRRSLRHMLEGSKQKSFSNEIEAAKKTK